MLEVYKLNQEEDWDKIVRSFKNYDTYWLSGYVKGFSVHGDGEPLLFYYSSKSTRGINVVMKRDVTTSLKLKNKIEENTFFDFSTPYGYGGWIVEGNDIGHLFTVYQNWCEHNNIVSEFVRFHPVIKNHIHIDNYYKTVSLGDIIVMDLSDPEKIWENISSKNRNMIRKALKNNIKIFNGRTPELFNKFKELYNETMNRDKADSYYYFNREFYQSICQELEYNSQIFYAELNGVIISAAIIISANGKLNYHLSGSKKEYGQLAPTNLLLYHVAKWGSLNGYKTLNLGGGVGSKEDSLYRFKKSFYHNKEYNNFIIGKMIVNQDVYNMLVDLNEDIGEEENYFPLYRA